MSTAAASAQTGFVARHVGPDSAQIARMLQAVGAASLDSLIDATVPENIRRREPLDLPAPHVGRRQPFAAAPAAPGCWPRASS